MPSIIGLVAATVLHGPNRPVLQVSVSPFIEFQDLGVLASAKAVIPPHPEPVKPTIIDSVLPPAKSNIDSHKPLLTHSPLNAGMQTATDIISAPMRDAHGTTAIAPIAPPIMSFAGLVASRTKPYSDTPLLPQSSQGEYGADKRISITAESLDLSQVIKGIANQAKVNIILAAKTNPQVNISLREMPLPNALRLLSAVAGMKFILVGDTFIFGDDDVLKSNFPDQFSLQYPGAKTPVLEMVTETYICTYVNASDAVNALRTSMADNKVNYAVGPGQIVPSSSGAGGGSTGSTTGGSSSGSTGSTQASTGGSTATGGASTAPSASGSNRTVIISGERDSVLRAIEVLKSLDVARPQVRIDVRMDDVSNDALKDLGTDWTFGNITLQERSTNDFRLQIFDRTPFSFQAVITALENSNKAKVLSAPNLTLLDQQTGYVLIGNRINYPVITSTNSLGNPVFDVKQVNVGVYMQVSASVSDSGEVTLWLYPQVSSITGFLNVNGASYPQISTRETQSTIRVPSGQTVVMAGLIQESEIKGWKQVPGFGDLPIIGEFFKRRTTTRTSSQIIVSLTPTIIK